MLGERRTKIVATIGPATQSRENLEKAIRSGMNVARLNFSHGNHADHQKVIQNIRQLSTVCRAPVAILQDLQGPKIRIGKIKGGSIELKPGAIFRLTSKSVEGDGDVLPVDFPGIAQSCKPGMKVLLDDGLLEMRVKDVTGDFVVCEVVYGGILKDRKGVNIPDAHLLVEAMTEKDLDDLEFGLSEKVDYVALSFVRSADDILRLKEIIQQRQSNAKVIAKIEMQGAVENLESIVKVSDGIMVARGDLAVEVGQSQLPLLQKRIIKLCNKEGRPVITATQMLDSMVNNPRPTRAEITDVANAVIDGSDALMLSAESASGQYPFKSIQTMHEIIVEVEKSADQYYKFKYSGVDEDIPDTVAAGACFSAQKANATAIVCLTTTGRTAARIAGFRPKARIIAITHLMETLNRLELIWGIETFAIRDYRTTDDAINQIESLLLSYGLVRPKDKVVLTLGLPVMARAKTNSIRVFEVSGSAKLLPDSDRPLRYQKS